ncbi:MAG: class I SAM-dependent RNA methyltransferase, partial [Pseudomonadota bacterium]
LPKLIRLTASRRTPLFNGALECRLLEYRMVAGGMRKVPAIDAKQQPDDFP